MTIVNTVKLAEGELLRNDLIDDLLRLGVGVYLHSRIVRDHLANLPAGYLVNGPAVIVVSKEIAEIVVFLEVEANLFLALGNFFRIFC